MPPLRLETIASRATALLSVPYTDQSVAKITTAVRLAAIAEVPDDAEPEVLEEVEASFLSTLIFEDLMSAIPCAPLWLLLQALIQRRFAATITVPPNNECPGPLSRRVGLALVRRLEELNMTEIPNVGEEYDLQYAALNNRRATHRNNLANDHGQQPQAPGGGEGNGGPVAPTEPARRAHAETRSHTHNRRAVQAHFPENAKNERAKFTGDLSKGPSFDLWDKRYRNLAKSLELTQKEGVQLLSEALADPALSFFYSDICPDDARSGNSIDEAMEDVPTNMAPNIATMSGALHAIKTRFCTDAARNVLKQELDQLRLSHIEMEENVSKPEALAILKHKIRKLSSNGPPEFSSEACMIQALRNCLDGEQWAVDPIVNCNDRANQNAANKTLEHYVQTLISYLREKENLAGVKPARAQPIVPTMFAKQPSGFGDARAHERRTRTTYQGPPRSGYRPQESSAPRSMPHGQARLPSQHDLRQMLARSSHQRPGQNSSGPPARMRPRTGNCWNCDAPGHLRHECPHPRRSSMDLARAMFCADVDPMEIVLHMAQDADEATQVP